MKMHRDEMEGPIFKRVNILSCLLILNPVSYRYMTESLSNFLRIEDDQMLSDQAKAQRSVIQAAFDAGGLDAICELFAKLEARIEELEKRLNMNSSNSSKPPSSDGLKRKTKSLRRKNTGRKPGGQPGHFRETALATDDSQAPLSSNE